MDPNSTDPNNPNNFTPIGGQPDLSSTTLGTNPVDTNLPATPPSLTPNQPENPATPANSNASIWTPPPTPTPSDMGTANPVPATSSLDNPFNVPTQPPTIDGGLPPTPLGTSYPGSTTPPSMDMNTSPVAPQPEPVFGSAQFNPQTLGTPQSTTSPISQPETIAPTPSPEPAPTDLSHLIPDSSANSQPEQPVYAPPITQPETLIVPSNGNEVEPNIPTENGHSKIPKWVIGLGVALLLAVAGASAYFILGVGQNIDISSLPAEEQSLSTPPIITPTTTPPVITPTITLPNNGSGFENLDSSGPTPSQASSAADLIRQRQQQNQ